jgi:LysR family carnitine catabolism transcriptional activator
MLLSRCTQVTNALLHLYLMKAGRPSPRYRSGPTLRFGEERLPHLGKIALRTARAIINWQRHFAQPFIRFGVQLMPSLESAIIPRGRILKTPGAARKMQSDLNLNLFHLRAAVCVAKQASFVAAANELHVSQSSLSRMIQSLEEMLGTSLFVRTTRRVELTPAGIDLIAMAERIIGDMDITLDNMASHSNQKRSQVIVSCLMSVVPGGLHRAVAKFHKKFPSTEVHVREGIQEQVEQDIRSGKADIAIAAIDKAATEFENRKLITEEVLVGFAKPHEFQNLEQVPFSRLKGQSLVSFPRGAKMRELVDSAAATAGFSLRHSFTASQILTLASITSSGVGITLVPSSATDLFYKLRLELRPLVHPKLVRHLGIIRLATRPKTTVADEFSNLIVDAFRE